MVYSPTFAMTYNVYIYEYHKYQRNVGKYTIHASYWL